MGLKISIPHIFSMIHVFTFDALHFHKGLTVILDGVAFDEDTFAHYTESKFREAYLANGLNFLSRIDGLFVITIIQNGVVSIVRDPIGKRPLYYASSKNGIVISDDIKEIRNRVDTNALDTSVLQSFKGIGYNLFSGKTIYEAIHSVPPGHIATFENTTEVVIHPYKSRDYLEDHVSSDLIQNVLDNSIKHCVSHSKTALFFSGGLDSSYLLVKGLEHGKLIPFTMWDGINKADLDDARALTNEESAPLIEEMVSPTEIDREVIDYAWHFSMPIGGGGFDLLGGVAFHILAKRISQAGFNSAICGEGADELFLGYHQYHMDPQTLVTKLSKLIGQFNLISLQDRLSELNVYSDTSRSLRIIASTYGLSEYHLPSVYASALASQLTITPPYLSFRLRALVDSLSEQALIDRRDNWTKLLLRQFFSKVRPHTLSRAAIRRKRSMAYSVLSMNDHINSVIAKSGTKLTKEEVFWRLFFFLHIENTFKSPPSITLPEVIPLLENLEVPV